jgi:hypothetical protein
MVIALVIVLFALGCADDDSGDSGGDAAAPPPASRSSEQPSESKRSVSPQGFSTENAPGLNVSEQEVYEEAKIVCGLSPPRKVAADFGLNTTNPDTIATRYARGYDQSVKQAAYEGCFRGLTK